MRMAIPMLTACTAAVGGVAVGALLEARDARAEVERLRQALATAGRAGAAGAAAAAPTSTAAAPPSADAAPFGSCRWTWAKCQELQKNPYTNPVAAQLGGEFCGMLAMYASMDRLDDASMQETCAKIAPYFTPEGVRKAIGRP